MSQGSTLTVSIHHEVVGYVVRGCDRHPCVRLLAVCATEEEAMERRNRFTGSTSTDALLPTRGRGCVAWIRPVSFCDE